jgi:hypothetical protein
MVFGLGRKKKEEQKKAKEQQAEEIAADEQPMEASLGEEQIVKYPAEKRVQPQSRPLPQPPVNPELQGWISALEQEYPVAIPIERLGQVMFAVFCELRQLRELTEKEMEDQ